MIKKTMITDQISSNERRSSKNQIIEINFDEKVFKKRNVKLDHERRIAIFDILENNWFDLCNKQSGPYRLNLAVREERLIIEVLSTEDIQLETIIVSLIPFRSLIKDYFIICESYFEAIKQAPRSTIQTLDMGRKGLHDDGAEILRGRISAKAEIDIDTSRRLFTLMCILHLRY